MKTIPHSTTILAFVFAAGVATSAAAEADGEALLAALTRTLAAAEPAAKKAPPKKGRRSSSQQSNGLQDSSLATGSLQPSSGLDSAARGLTPKDEWSRLFPRKEKP